MFFSHFASFSLHTALRWSQSVTNWFGPDGYRSELTSGKIPAKLPTTNKDGRQQAAFADGLVQKCAVLRVVGSDRVHVTNQSCREKETTSSVRSQYSWLARCCCAPKCDCRNHPCPNELWQNSTELNVRVCPVKRQTLVHLVALSPREPWCTLFEEWKQCRQSDEPKVWSGAKASWMKESWWKKNWGKSPPLLHRCIFSLYLLSPAFCCHSRGPWLGLSDTGECKEETNQPKTQQHWNFTLPLTRDPVTEMCENVLKHELVRFVGKAPRKDVNFNLYQSFTPKRRIWTVRLKELSSLNSFSLQSYGTHNMGGLWRKLEQILHLRLTKCGQMKRLKEESLNEPAAPLMSFRRQPLFHLLHSNVLLQIT